jgi:hypothetical protein
MIVLAFDLASNSGFAYGEAEPDVVPTFGSRRIGKPGCSRAAKSFHAKKWLAEILRSVRPDVVTYEAPMPTGRTIGRTNTDAVVTLHGLIWDLEGIAYALGIHDQRAASIVAVRRHFLGTDDLERKSGKLTTITRCHELGWRVEDDDAADACAVWSYQCAKINPLLAIRTAPLFLGIPGQSELEAQRSNAGNNAAEDPSVLRRNLNRHTVTAAGFGRLRVTHATKSATKKGFL